MSRSPLRSLLGLAAGATLAAAASACADRSPSDSSITESVDNRLEADRDLAAYDLEVETRDGIVTLEGTVPGETQRMAAERVARSTAGVQGVSNQIEIGGSPMTAPDVGAPGAPREPLETE